MSASLEIQKLLRHATPEELAEIDALLGAGDIWEPLPGPQTEAYESQADITGYGGAAGGGKGLALETPLRTAGGWTTMGRVSVGDQLFDEQGNPCRVTAVSDVSNRPCYRLVFDDGSELVADDVHRWVTFDAVELGRLTKSDPEWRARRRAARPSRAKACPKNAGSQANVAAMNRERVYDVRPPEGTMRDTAELARTLFTPAGRRNHAISLAKPLDAPRAALPLDPYVLGVWLGDGTSANSDITGVDDEQWTLLEACGETVRHSAKDRQRHLVEGLKPRLRDLGVLGNKHVPEAYLRASRDQRLALLQGLMDTDGHAAIDGKSEFDNTRKVLADAVLELALSLGLKATMREGVAKIGGQAIGPKWRVAFTTDLPVFRLTRKLARLKPCRRTNRFRYLVSCEPVESVPTRCIAVDSPSRLYLAGTSLIPTHNTDLLAGLVLTHHKRALIVRREKAQTEGVVQRLEEIVGHKNGYNSQKGFWRLPEGGMVEFAGLDNPGDERRWQGRPHDLKAFDEATEMREDQVRFIMGWTRSSDPSVRPRAILTFNPPTTAEGRWVIKFFGPWLDKKHPNPAATGELRWFTTKGDDQDYEVPDGRTFVFGEDENGEATDELIYDFDPLAYAEEKIIEPKSRTFIPARLTDNPYYMATGYMSTLQSLPEPLRSQMLYGDFAAGVMDDIMQVIPTRWVEIAQARWTKLDPKPEMDSIGVDVARGGKDNTVIARRHGWWFDELLTYKGTETPNGPSVAGLVIAAARDRAPIHVDVIGVGSSAYDFLKETKQPAFGINVAEKTGGTDRSGRLTFPNQRSEQWWKMRELLDPEANNGIALPPDPRLLADLTAPKWKLEGMKIKVESREEIIDRIKRSPDFASAVLLAAIETPKFHHIPGIQTTRAREYDPLAVASAVQSRTRDYDPMRF